GTDRTDRPSRRPRGTADREGRSVRSVPAPRGGAAGPGHEPWADRARRRELRRLPRDRQRPPSPGRLQAADFAEPRLASPLVPPRVHERAHPPPAAALVPAAPRGSVVPRAKPATGDPPGRG